MDFLEAQNQLKLEADQLLKQTNIENILSKCGDLIFEGSYVYELLVDRDVDISIIVEDSLLEYNNRSKIIEKLLLIENIRAIEMSDLHNFSREGRKPIDGIWFGLKIISKQTNQEWNFDLWFLTKEARKQAILDQNNAEINQKLQNLTLEQRKRILELKTKALESGEKQKGRTSFEIYQKVLND